MTDLRHKDMPWDDLHEECGVFAMYDFDGGDVASSIYYGLLLYSTEVRKAAALQFLTQMALREIMP